MKVLCEWHVKAVITHITTFFLLYQPPDNSRCFPLSDPFVSFRTKKHVVVDRLENSHERATFQRMENIFFISEGNFDDKTHDESSENHSRDWFVVLDCS